MKIFNFPLTLMRMGILVANSRTTGFLHKLKLFWCFLRLYLSERLRNKEKSPYKTRILGRSVVFSSASSAFYLFREIFVRSEYFFKSLSDSPKILDCGANVGMSILYFKNLFPNAQIFGFEANENAFELLSENVQSNLLKNVALHFGALCNQDGYLTLFKNMDPTSLLASIRQERGGHNEQKVPAIRLSNFLKKTNIDLVKMDVEGAEWEILEDLVAAKCLQNAEQYIIEFHHQIQGEKSELSKFLSPFEKAGFQYNIRPSFIEKKGYQNVVIHFYKDEKYCLVDEEMW